MTIADVPDELVDLVEELVPYAAELVGTVRDYGPDVVAGVLSRIPAGPRTDGTTGPYWEALAVVLAGMVDADRTPGQLLAWLDAPAQSRELAPGRRERTCCSQCGARVRVTSLPRHLAEVHPDDERASLALFPEKEAG